MYHQTNLFLLLLSTFTASVVKADMQLDPDEIPRPCTAICGPVSELSRTCDTDDDQVPDDHTEDLLEAQCICTNRSFDVARLAALCASCIDQNSSDADRLDNMDVLTTIFKPDIRAIMRTCGFSSTSYAPSASTLAEGVTVQATRPTASSQLTTTVTPGSVVTTTASGGSRGSSSGASTASSSTSANEGASRTGSQQPSPTTNAAVPVVTGAVRAASAGVGAAVVAGVLYLGL
ncbi:hypothetical protein VTK73DRAFT_1752 [Phialemonium thermophilum]|uniref:Protein CAP22 n=1 Tax=Phialemonium thermophilum TaxID=223376 RepID=A0ABR3X8T1_9PEZI